MPLGSPIGSNRGIETRAQIEIILEQARVPVVIDAGLGAPSHTASAMEMGADAVLVNTAIAFALSVQAGRVYYEMGASRVTKMANATSPLTSFLD